MENKIWHVANNKGIKVGPFSEQEILDGIKQGKVMRGMLVWKVGQDDLISIDNSVFSKNLPKVKMTSSEISNKVGILIGISIIMLFICMSISSYQSSVESSRASYEAMEKWRKQTAAPPPEDSFDRAVRLSRETNILSRALAISRPLMVPSVGHISDGAQIFCFWAAKNLTWSDMEQYPDNSYQEVFKDAVAHKGLKLCNRGEVIQITANRDLGNVTYDGILFGQSGQLIHFIAVGSTEGIVQGSWARYCGFVTELYQYDSADGGFKNSINSVGMFDIPQNHKQ